MTLTSVTHVATSGWQVDLTIKENVCEDHESYQSAMYIAHVQKLNTVISEWVALSWAI